jgi:hypothetical protein
MAVAKKLDRDRPYGQIYPPQGGAHFEQDHKFFDQHGRQVIKAGELAAEGAAADPGDGGAPSVSEVAPAAPPDVPTPGTEPETVTEPPSPSPPPPETETGPETAEDAPVPPVDTKPELGPIDPDMPWTLLRETIQSRFGVRVSNKQEALALLDTAGLMP